MKNKHLSNITDAERLRAYLAAIVESSDDAIISKQLDGRITSWNAAAERLFGYSAEEAIGQHISLIIPPERLDEEAHIIGKLLKGERIEHFETMRRRKDGRMVEISITVSPIRDEEGRIVGASKMARDISERRRAEQMQQEFNQRKDEFLANMSHELRTPMNAVVGLANILALTGPLTDQQRECIDTLKTSADSLLNLINDLLDYSRLEQDAIELEHIEFDLMQLATDVIDVASVAGHAKGLSLSMHYQAGLPRYFRGDPLRIQQVLTNLAGNAVKFTDKGDIELHIGGSVDGPGCTLAIEMRDSGIGIAPDKLETIFDKFAQADASITRRYGGSGLGLAICRSLVEKMQGSIHAESTPGVGTRFFVHLPLVHVQKLPQETPAPAAPEPVRAAILLVEDYGPNILVATTLLEQYGYRHDIARSGAEALERFREGRYDAILMDVQMQQMDGLETTRRIRAEEQARGLARTPIIAMTAHAFERDKTMCFEAGMDDFLSKPFKPELLQETLARHIPPPAALAS